MNPPSTACTASTSASARSTSTRSTSCRGPIAWAGSSDRNFYDRCYLNAHDRTGDLFLITGLGFYPNLGTKDAFVLLRRGDEQTAVHLSDAADPRGARPDGAAGRQLPDRGRRAAAQAAAGDGGDARDRARPDLGGLVRRRPGAAARDAPGLEHDPRCAAVRPGRHAGRARSRSTARTSRSRRTAGWAPGTGRGASARSARRPRPASRRTRRSRACGGSTCRCGSTTSAS